MTPMLPAHDGSISSLAARLAALRRQRFIGRGAELAMFREALQGEANDPALFYIYGPGGVGKTTLLHEYAFLAQEAARPCITLDGRNISPSPAAFELALRQALSIPEAQSLQDVLGELPKLVLLIDTYEQIAALDGWLRNTFLLQLSQHALVVLAGRNPPSHDWRTDDGWRTLTRFTPLANLPPDDCQRYLTARGVPADAQAAALAFTHGHPLALSLVADLYLRNPTSAALPAADKRGVIHLLLERILQDVPSTEHRQALELCAIALATTEALLVSRFGEQAGHDLFSWLRSLSFMEQGPHGLFPHDLVRDVLATDLHWRNPTAYADYRQCILAYLRQRHWQSSGSDQQRYGLDMMFVNRQAPGMKEFFAWDEMDSAYAEPATAADFEPILAMVRKHEGEASAAIARHWQDRQPDAFLAYRTNAGELYGFMVQLALERVTPADAAVDPAVDSVMRYIQTQRPFAAEEAGSFMRFWMAADAYQAVSPAINLAAANCVIHWRTTPNLVWSFVAMANPDFVAPHFESIRFGRTPTADFHVDSRTYGVFSRDWIKFPIHQWQVENRLADEKSLNELTLPAPELPLSEVEFATAVRQALRDYTRPDLLATNPLLQSSLCANGARTPEALRAHLEQAITNLGQNPKDAKFERALWHTYIEPAATQEQAAERLDLPFNTYRYHLNKGLERLTAALIRQAKITD